MPFGQRVKRKLGVSINSILQPYYRSRYGQCAVLLYHRVASLQTDPQLLSVTPVNFNSHLAHLKKKFNFISIDEFHHHLKNRKKFPLKSVVITFDDGYYDNLENALPILESHHSQGLFYICTGNLDTDKEFWWDEMERIFLLTEMLPSKLEITLNETMVFNTATFAGKKNAYESLLPVLRKMKPPLRDAKIKEMALWVNNSIPRESHRSLTFAELKSLSVSKSAIIGAHTINHPSLASLSFAEQRHEIVSSRMEIEKITGKEVLHFSFPFGTKSDYSNDTIKICKEEGFESASANYPKLVYANTDVFQFPRFLVRDWDVDTFAERMNYFFR